MGLLYFTNVWNAEQRGFYFAFVVLLLLIAMVKSMDNAKTLISICPLNVNQGVVNNNSPQHMAKCDKPVNILTSRDSFDDLSEKACKYIHNESMIIEQRDLLVSRLIFTDGRLSPESRKKWKPRSMMFWAYMLMIYGIEQFLDDYRGLWLKFGVSGGFSVNITSYVR